MAKYDFAQISKKKKKKNQHEIDTVLVHRDDGIGGVGARVLGGTNTVVGSCNFRGRVRHFFEAKN